VLTERRARAALVLYDQGVTVTEIARRFGCGTLAVKQALASDQEHVKTEGVKDERGR